MNNIWELSFSLVDYSFLNGRRAKLFFLKSWTILSLCILPQAKIGSPRRPYFLQKKFKIILYYRFCAETIAYSIGIESIVFVRDAKAAARAHFGFSSAEHSTRPITFCWFGHIIYQTLNAMIIPIHIPKPIDASRALLLVSPSVKASPM